jgi:hypothetical protein
LILMSCRPVPIRLLRDLFLHDSLFFWVLSFEFWIH